MSETRFDTSQRRNRSLVFLMDENVSGPSFVPLLRRVKGWRIEAHGDYLERGVSDIAVVSTCGQRGWSLITCDDMRYTPETKVAMVAWNVCSFKVITPKETHSIQIVSALIAGKSRMMDLLAKHWKHPFCAHVQLNGTVKVMTQFADIMLTESQRKTIRKYGSLREPPLWAESTNKRA